MTWAFEDPSFPRRPGEKPSEYVARYAQHMENAGLVKLVKAKAMPEASAETIVVKPEGGK